jgi:16S rRNA (cytosine967-C5)-methyltransferase
LFAALPEAASLCHPDWWVARLKVAYPESWPEIIAASNQPPPMALRVNLIRTTQEACLGRLQEAGIQAEARGKCGLLLARPAPIDRLPGFKDGELSVQDLGAQRAAQILSPSKGSRVLDACAAPGGKTAHLLEQGEDLLLVAQDIDPVRCQRIRENLVRLGLAAQIRVADATLPPEHTDREERFDAILADVPCSASGVARRFPDVKWLRRETDIANFARTQAKILAQLWPRLQTGGKLLYATCSIFPQENENQIRRFLKQNPNASLQHEEHLLPSAEHDGFYYALLQRHD